MHLDPRTLTPGSMVRPPWLLKAEDKPPGLAEASSTTTFMPACILATADNKKVLLTSGQKGTQVIIQQGWIAQISGEIASMFQTATCSCFVMTRR